LASAAAEEEAEVHLSRKKQMGKVEAFHNTHRVETMPLEHRT
jgi:hypothetical protein